MSVNNDKLAQLLALLLDDGSSEQQQPEQQPEQQESSKEEQQEQQPKESSEEQQKEESNDDSEDDSGSGEKYDKVDEELRKKLDEQFTKVASTHIVSVKELLQFVNYDTMKNENGDLDEDKASSLVTVISNISLRKPPSSGASQNLSRSQRGMGKYLKN